MDRTLLALCTLLGIVVVTSMALVAGGGLSFSDAAELQVGFIGIMSVAIGYRLATGQRNRPSRRWRCVSVSCGTHLP